MQDMPPLGVSPPARLHVARGADPPAAAGLPSGAEQAESAAVAARANATMVFIGGVTPSQQGGNLRARNNVFPSWTGNSARCSVFGMRVLLLLFFIAGAAHAQVYRWVDKNGTVNYSNEAPATDAAATQIPIDAKPGAPSPDTKDCYTVRCQGERMEQRIAMREKSEARAQRERQALAPPQPRGLEFRKYISIQRGMSMGELITIAGRWDVVYSEWSGTLWTYLPITGEPWTTTITLINGRVHDIDRQRKF